MKYHQAHLAILVLLTAIGIAQAGLDFYGYRRVENTKDSTVSFVRTKIGTTELERSKIEIIPKGSYFDVTEHAWLSGNITLTQQSDLMDEYLYKGSLPIPRGAAVSGLMTIRNGTTYQAKLKKATYVVDQTLPDSASLFEGLNSRIAHLQQLTDNNYEATFTKAELGERKYIKIRYMLPNRAGGAGKFTIPVLFHPTGATPEFIEVTLHANDSTHSYYLAAPSGSILLSDVETNLIPYRSSVTLTHTDTTLSSMHIGTFPSGDWAGKYVMINSTVSDSLIGLLSNKMETVFVWRWNSPHTLVTFTNGVKGLSPYANVVLTQARDMLSAIRTLGERGHGVSLIHSMEGQPDYISTMSTKGTPEFDSLVAYLGKFDEQYIYTTFGEIPKNRPTWAPIEFPASTAIETAKKDMERILKTAQTLYSSDTLTVYKHIVLRSIGDAPVDYTTIRKEQMDSLLAGTSIDAGTSSWRGIDIATVVPRVSEQRLSFWEGFYFPYFQPVTLHMRLFSANRTYAFPLSAQPQTFGATAKGTVDQEWLRQVEWIGYDPEGKTTAIKRFTPRLYTSVGDSGLALVWARDENHISEVETPIEEANLGIKYGILTKATIFQATIEDSTTDTSSTIPFLTDAEKPTGVVIRGDNFSRGQQHRLKAIFYRDMLELKLTRSLDDAKLYVYDLRGRLIGMFALSRYATGPLSYQLHLADSLPAGTRVLVCRIVSPNFTKAFSVIRMNR